MAFSKGYTVCDSTYITLLECKIRRTENQWLPWTRDFCKEMVRMNQKREQETGLYGDRTVLCLKQYSVT